MEELIVEVEDRVFITEYIMGIGQANTITGEVSEVVSNTFLDRKGKPVNPLEPVIIACDFTCLHA